MIVDEILVLKEIKYKENDKILHALSRTRGKIQLLSKGCKKNNSHLINVSQLFSHSKCSMIKSKDMYIITSAELIDSFYNLKNNIDAFFYGNYILELINYVSQENECDYRIFDMTVAVLSRFSVITKDFEKLTAAYELKLVSMLGYKPNFKHCLLCGKEIKSDSEFSIKEGGLFCHKCASYGRGINVSYGEILTMERILKSKFENIGSFDVNTKLLQLIRNFLFYYIGKNNFTTLKLLKL